MENITEQISTWIHTLSKEDLSFYKDTDHCYLIYYDIPNPLNDILQQEYHCQNNKYHTYLQIEYDVDTENIKISICLSDDGRTIEPSQMFVSEQEYLDFIQLLRQSIKEQITVEIDYDLD